MKKRVILLMLLSLANMSFANELEGVWKLMSGEYINAEGELVTYQSLDLQALKILSPTHFSFTSVKGDTFWASATGTYKVINGQYIEVLKYNSFGEPQGAEFVFNTKVEGEYWYNSRWDGDTRVEYEVWQKVE